LLVVGRDRSRPVFTVDGCYFTFAEGLCFFTRGSRILREAYVFLQEAHGFYERLMFFYKRLTDFTRGLCFFTRGSPIFTRGLCFFTRGSRILREAYVFLQEAHLFLREASFLLFYCYHSIFLANFKKTSFIDVTLNWFFKFFGVSNASITPSTIIETRLQYSASSI